MTLPSLNAQDRSVTNDPPNFKDGITKITKKAPIDPLSITESLGYQTFRRESRKPWSKVEDELLKKLVLEQMSQNPGLKDLDNIKWDLVCERLGSDLRKAKDCRKRWSSSLDPNLRRGKWTLEEDEKLLLAFQKFGASWQKVSMEIEGRTDDQCAKRYIEVLDPNTKDRLRKWDRDEDLELIRKVKVYGTKWRTISLEMKGRPSLTCRNRWRKIVTDVVRGKADLAIRKEVDMINGTGEVKLENMVNEEERSTSDQNRRNNVSNVSTPLYPLSQDNEPSSSTRGNSPLTELSQVLERQIIDSRKEQQPIRQDPPINLNMYSSVPNRANTSSPRPVQSKTDWRYSLNSSLGDDIPNGFGAIDSQESAQRLIDLAKKHGISVTVHQHITHHYAPQQQSILEPETQLSRYQHFNYLPPLAEVPKLNSSNTSPAGSSGSNGKESDLVKLLNNDRSRNLGAGAMSPPLNYKETRSPKRSRLNNNYNSYRSGNISSYGTSRQQLYPTGPRSSSASQRSNMTLSKPNEMEPPTREDLEEELDFWETMKTFAQLPLSTQPVSQHHPLHYQQQSSKGISMPSNYHPSHQLSSSSIPGIAGTFGAIYGYDEDEEEEDESERGYHAGMYYNTSSSGNYPSVYPNADYLNNEDSDEESNASDSASSKDAEELGIGSFGLFPFNPS